MANVQYREAYCLMLPLHDRTDLAHGLEPTPSSHEPSVDASVTLFPLFLPARTACFNAHMLSLAL